MSSFLGSDDAEVVRRSPEANLHPVLRPGLPLRLGGLVSRGRSRRLALSDPPSVLPKRSIGWRARTGVPTTRPVQSRVPLAEHLVLGPHSRSTRYSGLAPRLRMDPFPRGPSAAPGTCDYPGLKPWSDCLRYWPRLREIARDCGRSREMQSRLNEVDEHCGATT